ncbi:hypothetical protein HZC08_01750, partial [Candidatus Micrarchaeota archaeon]|nr:hypothetical protein [Candidatus Micrarchaeota archaeon]
FHERLITEEEQKEAELVTDEKNGNEFFVIRSLIDPFSSFVKAKTKSISEKDLECLKSEKTIRKEEIGPILDSMDLW